MEVGDLVRYDLAYFMRWYAEDHDPLNPTHPTVVEGIVEKMLDSSCLALNVVFTYPVSFRDEAYNCFRCYQIPDGSWLLKVVNDEKLIVSWTKA